MSEVALRELHNNAAGVLRRAQAVEQIVITSRGKPVASLDVLEQPRRRRLLRAELGARLAVAQADPGLREDLARLAGDTTEDLGPPSEQAPQRGMATASRRHPRQRLRTSRLHSRTERAAV